MVASEIAVGSAARANGADRQLSGQDEAPCNRFWLPERLASSAFTSLDVCWPTAAPSSRLDNLNSYYDPELKKARLAELAAYPNFHFQQRDVADRAAIAELFAAYRFDSVIHLAAQAGVRYSLVDPHAYADANVVGFLNILEGCRHTGCKHLIYASSSSVYGANTRMPLRATDNTDHPLSLYGATKKANELMAHAYASLFGLPATGLRFFTVYGPWGRPDMAMWLFTAAIMDGTPLKLFNNGRMRRDFTYIDDVTEAVIRLVEAPARAKSRLVGRYARSGDKPCAVAAL